MSPELLTFTKSVFAYLDFRIPVENLTNSGGRASGIDEPEDELDAEENDIEVEIDGENGDADEEVTIDDLDDL